MPVEKRFAGQTIACIATGPSLTLQQVEAARRKGFVLFGCNNVWRDVPDLSLLYACNEEWWVRSWCDELKQYPAEKWTTNKVAADKFSLNWIAEKFDQGLSTNPRIVHHGHGSGYTMLNLAYLMGASRIVLLGYDCKYAPDYDGRAKKVGSTPRHYWAENGGEYHSSMQHWPIFSIKDGVHVEMVALYASVAMQKVVEIVNCTPDSAIDCFPRADIESL
jgi:hypothetical protein